MVFCCAELLFKMLLAFTNEKLEVHMHAVSAMEIVECCSGILAVIPMS
jgi:hypothetical protein